MTSKNQNSNKKQTSKKPAEPKKEPKRIIINSEEDLLREARKIIKENKKLFDILKEL